MRALHFDGAELRCIDDHPEPSPGTDEAVVRVHMAGVCSTDLQIMAGYMGFTGVPGHGFVGEVVDLVGKHVKNLALVAGRRGRPGPRRPPRDRQSPDQSLGGTDSRTTIPIRADGEGWRLSPFRSEGQVPHQV
jgi:threonine dehydrogenase-like Zn-dependent dehydrogenase